MSHTALISILLLSPLIGFLFNGLRYQSKDVKISGVVGTLAVFVSFICSVMLFFKLTALPEAERVLSVHYFDWIHIGSFIAEAGFLVDPISVVMILVVTGVGTLIHLFSMGYMSHDERPSKYFAYLNFFIFNMLILVLGDNLLVMFVGWEGVGLASYLLIGFWFKDKEKSAAGMKAFITNRIGDAAFLLGIFVLFTSFGTVSFVALNEAMPASPELLWSGPITLACLLLFIGATGKSAQIPLYVWLPDAMAGPTPVSALIHAATMVTAGVYMIVRMSGVFMAAPNAMMVVAIIGGLTAVVAAIIGLTQWDIKKVLAYSTVSQLGYMFLACGVGAFMPALFHLMTHAFFKALMFLGSGSVIHAMDGEQDIRKMGGLKKLLPITHITFLFGWIAIIGLPPFAGFFSKDEILWFAFSSPQGSKMLWLLGVLGAGLTAFYMTRLMCLVFWTKSRVPEKIHPHESPPVMTIPLLVLAGLSLVGGWIGLPHAITALMPGTGNVLHHWLEYYLVEPEIPHGPLVLEWALIGISVSIAGLSAWYAYYSYMVRTDLPEKITQKIKPAYEFAANKYYVDEFYFSKIINPTVDLSKGLWAYIDVNLIDRTTHWITDVIKSSGGALRSIQNGNVQQYALYITLGVVVTIIFMFAGQ